MRKIIKLFVAILVSGFLSTSLFASNISLNLGYQNPGYSDAFGVNFMQSWTNFAYEFGVALFNYSNEEFTSLTKDAIFGSANLKYIFPGSAKVFIQGGNHFYYDSEDANGDSKFEFTDWFGGLGFFCGDLSKVYGYASLNYGEAKHFFNTIGFGVTLF